MKIAVINFSGNVGKTTVARHLLFVRRTHQDPFRFLGNLRHVASQSAKPMSITWQVTPPMPMDLVEGHGVTG